MSNTTLCDTCVKADKVCPVFPQRTKKCIEYVGKKMKLKFEIEQPRDNSAGIYGFTDIVEIHVYSGDAGGDTGEFMEFMQSALTEWYDGARVSAEQVTSS